MGVATAVIAVGIAITAALGPEKRGSRFETTAPAGTDVEALVKRPSDAEAGSESDGGGRGEKGGEERIERV